MKEGYQGNQIQNERYISFKDLNISNVDISKLKYSQGSL